MRIVVLDYAGHIPQADLARNLAKLGHTVRHMYCSDYVSGRGAVEREADDPKDLEFLPLSINARYNRYNPLERLNHEMKTSKIFLDAILGFNPEVVIFSNIPLLTMYRLAHSMQKVGIPYIHWWQDVISIAMGNALRKFGLFAFPVKRLLIHMESWIVAHARTVIAITPNFERIYRKWGLDLNNFVIYPNWTPSKMFLEPPSSQDSQWTSDQKLVVYAGTLGLKHRPKLLIALADDTAFKKLNGVVVVVSQGLGRKFLDQPENRRENLKVMDFLEISELSGLFHQASVLLAVLEPEASEFSVPSKIMSYLTVGKPIVASISSENASAIILTETGAGIVVSPTSSDKSFADAVVTILTNAGLSSRMGDAGFRFAAENFDGSKAAQFFLNQIYK